MPVLNPDKSPAIATTAKRPPKPGPGYQWIGGQWLLYDPVVAPLPPGIYQDPVSDPWNPENIPGTGARQDVIDEIKDYGVDVGSIFGGATGYETIPKQPQQPDKPAEIPSIDIGELDLDAALKNDPEYLAKLAGIGEMNRADEATMRNKLRSLAIGWGGDLSSLLSTGLIDQGTLDAAGANQFSTMAELGRALTRGRQQATANLGARGMGRSGAMPILRGQLDEQYARQSSQAGQAFTGNVQDLRDALATAMANREAERQLTLGQVATRLAQLPQYAQRGTIKAKWNADYGGYVTPDGRLYDANGKMLSRVF